MTVRSLDHVLVLADDIEATREFYCQAVGLHVGDRPPLEFPGYWLYAGEGGSGGGAGGVGDSRGTGGAQGPGACLHIAERGAYAAHATALGLRVPERDPGVGPVDHVAFRAGDYRGVIERLKRCGIAAVTNAVPGGPRQVFIEDPNGVRVEISVVDSAAEGPD